MIGTSATALLLKTYSVRPEFLTELAKPFQRNIMLLVCPCEVREPGEIVETESFNGNYLSERCCRG